MALGLGSASSEVRGGRALVANATVPMALGAVRKQNGKREKRLMVSFWCKQATIRGPEYDDDDWNVCLPSWTAKPVRSGRVVRLRKVLE